MKCIFFGRQDPLLCIPGKDLDLLLRRHLEPIEFDLSALCEVLRSLHHDRHAAPFYSGLLESDAFHQCWQQQHNAEVERHRRHLDYIEALRLAEKIRELNAENQVLWS